MRLQQRLRHHLRDKPNPEIILNQGNQQIRGSSLRIRLNLRMLFKEKRLIQLIAGGSLSKADPWIPFQLPQIPAFFAQLLILVSSGQYFGKSD